MIAKAKLDTKCITKDCEHRPQSLSRGLCPQCYNAARELVRHGRATWEELEKMNLILPRQRAVIGSFRLAFEKKQGQLLAK